MIPYKQAIQHDPANGHFGDCWRTCLGCLLHIDPLEIPHFGAMGDKWRRATQEWLAERGLCLLEFNLGSSADLSILNSKIKGLYHIISGRSPRVFDHDQAVGHSVIGLDGMIAHDPNPDALGLYGSSANWDYGFLVRLNDKPLVL